MLERLTNQGLEDARRQARMEGESGRSIRIVQVGEGDEPTIIDEEHRLTSDQLAAAAARMRDLDEADDE